MGSITSSIWLAIVLALSLFGGAQSWRLHGSQIAFSEFKEQSAIEAKERIEKYEEISEFRRNSERSFQIQTQGVSDALTTEKINTDRVLRRDLDDAMGLLKSAEARYSSYRAATESGASACRSLADRAEALDRLVTEGIGLVAEGKSLIANRDSEVAALWAYSQELRKLLGKDGDHE